MTNEKNQTDRPESPTRRDFVQKTAGLLGAGALLAGLPPFRNMVWAAGSDAPEKAEVKVGFIPLTDCASVVMAAELGFDRKYGIKIVPSKEASWAGVRDKLVNGELDAAHVLYGLIYGVQMGIGGPQRDMAVLMKINNNGQAITLSNHIKEKGVTDGSQLKSLVDRREKEYTFAQTFPTGTHAMWLYYWLAASGIHPLQDVKTIVVPPPQMVANMRVGNMDGYCVGEPWNARAIADRIGFTVTTSQAIWPDHPEKVLASTAVWVAQYPSTARALIAAVLEASRWIDASEENKAKMALTIAQKSYVNTTAKVIEGRILGHYEDGLGKTWRDPHPMQFFRDGQVNFPYLSDGMWFLTQHRRWGLLKEDPDYLAIARKVNRIALYKEAATLAKVPIPDREMRASTLMDGITWDGRNPQTYATGFSIKA
jgi:nitrate/nitrite transport system substrate-binding protein